MLSDIDVEIASLRDLHRLCKEATKWGIPLVVIGGYAIRAYTRGYRFTKDIDLVTPRKAVGRFKALLRNLGYTYRTTEFGVAGSKKFDDGFIDLHISVGDVFDISTGFTFAVTEEFFEKARNRVIKEYYEESEPFAVDGPVAEMESMLLLKLIPRGRVKDLVDITALIIDKGDEVDKKTLADQCKASGLRSHIISQLRNYANLIRKSELEKLWFSLTGLRLSYSERRAIMKFVRTLIDVFRKDNSEETPSVFKAARSIKFEGFDNFPVELTLI